MPHETRPCRHALPAGGRRHPKLTLAAWCLALGSLAWLLLRSALRPDRLAYPCQRAALGHVVVLLGLPLAHFARRAFGRRGGLGLGFALVGSVAVVSLGLSDFVPRELAAMGRPAYTLPSRAEAAADYTATLYVAHDVGGPAGDHHLGVDELLATMASGGQPFYESATAGGEAGPNGIVGADDIVLIKINEQWPERGGTNTDVLKGLIARILEHPDGFTGEIVVVENGQGSGDLDRALCNAEDHGQSPVDVVNHFAGLGHPVGAYLWDSIRGTQVSEYSAGNYTDGYVLGVYDPATYLTVSHPKFRTPGNRYVSLRDGVWDPVGGTYDQDRLTFLNLPVLKCHGAVYGVTAATKHHVGTMTTALATNTHFAVRYGGLGRFLSEIRRPDLNILDAIYILAIPNGGPWCTYAEATRVDKLVAGVDPIALDMWATKNILVPTLIANGYPTYPMQDPDNADSIFRTYLDRAMNQMLAAGIDVTNDLSRVNVISNEGAVDAPMVESPVAARAIPNPLRDSTSIRFAATRAGEARLDVYDVSGRLVRTVRRSVSAGESQMSWDGRDESGRRLPAGTYLWRVSGAGEGASGKVTLLR